MSDQSEPVPAVAQPVVRETVGVVAVIVASIGAAAANVFWLKACLQPHHGPHQWLQAFGGPLS